ncbi:hypothetical protein RJ639_046044 [Escallonia herrerae]|uniref:Uncharacterized protein n=1 Tax=Escallonia herrerae TaxID=1293975 RepID=A0AA88W8B7_9ASTE|nr:hypothetical protein RJ639_046044 [Escallonia herrerae]
MAGRIIPSSVPSTALPSGFQAPDYVPLKPRPNQEQRAFHDKEAKSCMPKGFRHSSAPSRLLHQLKPQMGRIQKPQLQRLESGIQFQSPETAASILASPLAYLRNISTAKALSVFCKGSQINIFGDREHEGSTCVAMESSSSKKRTHGADCLALSKISRTLASLSPNHMISSDTFYGIIQWQYMDTLPILDIRALVYRHNISKTNPQV